MYIYIHTYIYIPIYTAQLDRAEVFQDIGHIRDTLPCAVVAISHRILFVLYHTKERG